MGLDGISCKALKSIKSIILDKLTSSINHCLEVGYFPNSLKVAKVSPIYKSGNKTDPNNYRPISVLPSISKIFEKIIFNRLDNFLKSVNFFYHKQYGFRNKSNTLTACIDLVTKLKRKIDKKQICLGIFIDLKKAFDTISHKLLLHKLATIGVKNTAHKLLQSYLSDRYQQVKIGTTASSLEPITYGVPQGSILGPLLFLVYINSIKDLGLVGDITLYADDTCLFYFANDIHTVVRQAQSDLDLLYTWFQYNLLTVNISKTNFVIFSAKNKKIATFNPLHINNEQITRVNSHKYLGLVLDNHLIWKTHLNKIRSKLSNLMGTLRGIVRCFPASVRYIIYNSLIKSHLTYLIEVWGAACKTNLKQLQIAQNKIIKLLFHLPYSTPTSIVYKKTKLMSLSQMYKYNTCILIKKILAKDSHSQIIFTKKAQFQTRKMRSANNISLYRPRTNYGTKNILFEGVKMYNSIPNDIKGSQSLSLFKNKLKCHIMDMPFNQ